VFHRIALSIYVGNYSLNAASLHPIYSITTDLVAAGPRDEFFKAFQVAMVELDHHDFGLHNQFVECGLALVLTRCLARAICLQDQHFHQIEPICRLLVIIFRCHTQVATATVQEIAGELYPLLLNLPFLALPSSVLHLIERISCLPVFFSNPSLVLRHFRESVVLRRTYELDTNGQCDVMSSFFCLIKGLTNVTKSRHLIIDSPSLLLNQILDASRCSCSDAFSRKAIHFILLLAQDSHGRVRLAENKRFRTLIVALLSCGVVGNIKRALSLIGRVSADRSARKLMSMDKFEIFDAMIKCEKTCSIAELRDTYILTVRKLISPDTANSELVDSILNNENASNLLIARCVYRLSAVGLLVSGKGMDRLLDAILKATGSASRQERYIGARALLQQSQNEGCSFFLMRTSSVINVVTSLIKDDRVQTIRAVGVRIAKNIASCSLNHRIFCRQGELLAALCVAATCAISQSWCLARQDAVKALLHVAEAPNSTIAKQHNFVSTLAKYGLQKYDDEAENEIQKRALQCVLKLIAFM
jgi:hypothetical protein